VAVRSGGMFDDAIDEFWDWWDGVRDELATAIDDESPTDIPDELTDKVWRIHPDLDWQLAPGSGARHSLNLVSGGTRLLRLVSELWRRKGPEADETWEYHPARVPFPPESFLVSGVEIDPTDATVSLTPDDTYRRLDTTIAHPAFADLSDDDAREVALYLLDATLGEDDAERWIGILQPTAEPQGTALADVAATVDRLVDGWDGDGWEDVSDQYDGVVEARVDRSLKWIDHLDKPIYAEITIASLANDTDGFPADLELNRLESLTRDLLARLGDGAVLAGTATGDGERSIHLFMRNDPDLNAVVETWVEVNPNRSIDTEFAPDEQWSYAEQWD
jgi:hypothetical protein